MGELLLKKGDTEGAEYRFNLGKKSDPKLAAAYHGLATVALRRGNPDEAIRMDQEAVRLNPRYTEAHNQLGQTYKKKGMAKQANEQFGKAIGVESLDAAGNPANLESPFATVSADEKTEKDLETRLAQNPKDASAQLGLGRISYESGDYDRAVELLRKAAKNSPKNGEAQYFLGMAYVKKEKASEAVAALKTYLKLEPKASNRTEVEAQIRKLKK
jgi:Flp pilus assembly protein TadD